MNSVVKFKPWVGENYETGIHQGKKLMILGESHYCANPETEATEDITIKIIEDLLDPFSEHEGYKNTYTKFAKAVVGEKQFSDETKKEFWQHVIFYNYVQTAISGARVSPTTEQFRNSEQAFFEIISQYQPNLIIVWGKRLYNNLPQQGTQLPDLQISQGIYAGESSEVWSYTIGGKTIALLPITHPSASMFELQYHKDLIYQFIEKY
ncbi:MAG: hypothetical protein UHK52_02875 [Bacteroidales bacterium]|nr:hypothetical protein [Bacteroidales bacterium]